MSLYEVSDVVVGESFLARDLVRGGEPVRVFERSATRSLSQWDRIAARVVTVLGKTQISGAVLPFSHPLAKEAVASIERVRKKARAEAGKLAKSLGRNVDEIDFAAVTGLEEVLASSAFMFSNLWLNDALRRSLNPTLPQIENTDGDPLEFITVAHACASGRSGAARAMTDADAADAFFDFRVADIAMGSGHFLVAALRACRASLTASASASASCPSAWALLHAAAMAAAVAHPAAARAPDLREEVVVNVGRRVRASEWARLPRPAAR